MRTTAIALLIWILCPIGTASAQSRVKLARETADFLMRQFVRETAETTVELLTRRIETQLARHGSDVIKAVRLAGPQGLKAIEEAGERGAATAKILAKYGDNALRVVSKSNLLNLVVALGGDTAEVLIKHGESCESLLAAYGETAVRALMKITRQNARRMAMLENDGILFRSRRAKALLEAIAQHGDRAVEFLWTARPSLENNEWTDHFLADPRSAFEEAEFSLATPKPRDLAKLDASNREQNLYWDVLGFLVVIAGVLLWHRNRVRGLQNAINQ